MALTIIASSGNGRIGKLVLVGRIRMHFWSRFFGRRSKIGGTSGTGSTRRRRLYRDGRRLGRVNGGHRGRGVRSRPFRRRVLILTTATPQTFCDWFTKTADHPQSIHWCRDPKGRLNCSWNGGDLNLTWLVTRIWIKTSKKRYKSRRKAEKKRPIPSLVGLRGLIEEISGLVDPLPIFDSIVNTYYQWTVGSTIW